MPEMPRVAQQLHPRRIRPTPPIRRDAIALILESAEREEEPAVLPAGVSQYTVPERRGLEGKRFFIPTVMGKHTARLQV